MSRQLSAAEEIFVGRLELHADKVKDEKTNWFTLSGRYGFGEIALGGRPDERLKFL